MKTPISDEKKELLKTLRKLWGRNRFGDQGIINFVFQVLPQTQIKKLSDLSDKDLQRVIDAYRLFPETKKEILDLVLNKINKLKDASKWFEVQMLIRFYEDIDRRF
jgi:hypothetical protein